MRHAYKDISYYLGKFGPLFEEEGYAKLEVDTNPQILGDGISRQWSMAFWKDIAKSEGVLVSMLSVWETDCTGNRTSYEPQLLLFGKNETLCNKLQLPKKSRSADIIVNGAFYQCRSTKERALYKLLK